MTFEGAAVFVVSICFGKRALKSENITDKDEEWPTSRDVLD